MIGRLSRLDYARDAAAGKTGFTRWLAWAIALILGPP
jgi:hypothetical protein